MKQAELIYRLNEEIEKLQVTADDLDWNIYEETIEDIKSCPRTRTITFRCCGIDAEFSIENIYGNCPKCKQKVKMRAFSARRTIEDVLFAAKRFFEGS